MKRGDGKKSFFTLLELVVVIGILALTATISVATLRTDSPVARLNAAALHFEEFCTAARFFALEDGTEKIVLFDPASKTFSLKQPSLKAEDGTEVPADELSVPGRMKISWTIPEGFELSENFEQDTADFTDENGRIEMFHFFSDGSASGKRKFELRFGNLRKSFEISPLTGRLNRGTEEPGEGSL